MTKTTIMMVAAVIVMVVVVVVMVVIVGMMVVALMVTVPITPTAKTAMGRATFPELVLVAPRVVPLKAA